VLFLWTSIWRERDTSLTEINFSRTNYNHLKEFNQFQEVVKSMHCWHSFSIPYEFYFRDFSSQMLVSRMNAGHCIK
jgi:hypothetical protein